MVRRSLQTFVACLCVVAAGCNRSDSGAGERAGKSPEPPPGTYGELLGEQVAPADPSKPGTIMRSRAGDTVYRLSNARFSHDQFGRPTLEVDYKMARRGEHNGVTLVMHGADGSMRSYLIAGPMQERGTLSVDLPFPLPPGQPPLPKDAEVYLTRTDMRYVPDSPSFKVSNSAMMGNMSQRMHPRNWTAQEIARLTAPPPNYTTPNLHPGVGRDTEFAGDSSGGLPNRYVEPNGKLVGVEYQPWDWEGEKTFWGITPVFDPAQPKVLTSRVIAREGYAVGAVNVKSKKFVNALQLVFYKVKPDGTLDKSDAYESEWMGDASSDAAPKALGGDGTTVIGIVCQKGAIVNGLALVLAQ